MQYKYTVSTINKKVLRGIIDADSEDMAEATLLQAGFHRVLTLKEIRQSISLERWFPTLFGVKPQEVIDFSLQLAELIESGVDILTALQLLKGQASKPSLKRIISGAINELREGRPMSDAFGKYPEAFSHTYQQMIMASEKAGNLEVGLRQMAEYMQKRLAAKAKVTRALSYPLLVLLMAVGVVALLVTIVLPSLVGMFSSFDADLPWMTKMVMTVASFLTDYKLYLLVGLVTLGALGFGYTRLPEGKRTMDKLMLKMPVIGSINVQRTMSHFCRTMAMLLRTGLLLPQSMATVSQTIGNDVVRQALEEVREQAVQGQGLSGPMGANPIFPRLLVDMLAIGEKTGKIESSLATLADFYEHKADRRIDTLVSMIEPTMTIAVGVVIALIALSIVTPLYSILNAVE